MCRLRARGACDGFCVRDGTRGSPEIQIRFSHIAFN
ncbi:hypothetical protein PQA65_gp39 [Yersinia phage vB_YenM_42.18]|uniref:Uncharacterized protein n=1 Tax=Yersinia phage vB_YenM_42.18 TaxID=2918926 RepID=A0AAE9FQ13_9CAUD|nr:hypothetical protein PQA65_gp39 [Yersinia phage vB_YenM_42.18]UNA05753.1 hypothetical protein vBYenM4218_039 [Yersinia phage vB_YenM_42.18]